MSQYEDSAYAAAILGGYTWQQVAGATYAQVAQYSGVVLRGDGSSPDDFFWKHVKRYVATRLKKEADDAASETRRQQLRNKVLELAQWAGVTVTRVNEGETAEGPGWFVEKEF